MDSPHVIKPLNGAVKLLRNIIRCCKAIGICAKLARDSLGSSELWPMVDNVTDSRLGCTNVSEFPIALSQTGIQAVDTGIVVV